MKAGINQYDWEITTQNEGVLLDDDGTGFSISPGWQYRFDGGLAFKISYEYLNLGSDFDINSVGLGLSYSF